jgi:hypothetical protein
MLILFVGKKESGKSTAGEILRHYGFYNVNFKDALNFEIEKFFPELLGVIAKKHKKSAHEIVMSKPLVPEIRALKRDFGTVFRRAHDSDYWVRYWKYAIRKLKNKHPFIYADDARFLNEAKAGKKFGAIIIRIKRKSADGRKDKHQSETEQDQIVADYTIENNGTIAELHDKVKKIVVEIVKSELVVVERKYIWWVILGAALCAGLFFSGVSLFVNTFCNK